MFSSKFMFKSAKINLTVWYAIIIIAVSAVFSLILYRVVALDLKRRFENIETRIMAGTRVPQHNLHNFFVEGLEDAKHNVALQLIYVNGIIVFFASAAGYILATKTIDPIEKAHEKQKRFIADASHEFKTPLTALRTSIEVALRDKKMTIKEARLILNDNLDDINSLEVLSTNLLSLARHKQKEGAIIYSKTNIIPIIESSIKKLNPLATRNKLVIKTKLTKQTLLANEEQIEKLITILLDNAIKYTLKKGVVTISNQKVGKNIVIKVIDTGMGIAKKDLPHIFDRFYRADQSRSKSKVDGHGLGLCLAKSIVNDHKGKISVESTLGKGTTITVKLPQ